MAVRAVVFDFGGVLARGDRSRLDAVGAEFGLSRDEILEPFRGPRAAENTLAGNRFGFTELQHAIAGGLPARLGERTSEVAAQLMRVYTDPSWMEPISEMVALLTELQATGVPVAALSNGPRGVVESSWGPLLGDALPGAIHLSGEAGIGKPHAAAFEAVASALGFPVDECFFIDDTQHHVDGARAAGMRAMRFEGNASDIRSELRSLGLLE